MKLRNTHRLPTALVAAVTNDPYNAGECDFTTSTLILPPQIYQLRLRYWDQIEEDAMDRIWSLLGQAIHHILERGAKDSAIFKGKNYLFEQRVFFQVDNRVVSTQIDHWVDGTLFDYKVTSVWSVIDGPKPEWTAQLNIGAYGLRVTHNLETTALKNVCILRDWSMNRAKRGQGYPPNQVKTVSNKLWTMEEQYDFISRRIALHEAAGEVSDEELAELFPCSFEERWAKPTTYAVMKKGRKTALRVFASKEEAENFFLANGGLKSDVLRIEVRPGEQTRCEKYCSVAPFCHQFKALKAA
ncbi:MAG: hypothetical protein JRJ29_00370 [Deltaproteobacteria bacterium]|nr:hypothetical protein [Deltaproteobacteria bacterium]MBW2081621.1 hypothetical protein [Deltaproteobacteria bacterium]